MNRWAVWFWLVAIFTGYIGFEAAGLTRAVTWQGILLAKNTVSHFAQAHQIETVLAFLGVYVLTALLLCPAQLWLIVAGGFLFGLVEGALVSWIAALLGAIAVFVAARGALGDSYLRRASWFVAHIESEFQRDSWLYMLALRWLPFSPYWVANVVPPLLDARVGPYLTVAVVGVLSDIVTYSLIGSGLRNIVVSGQLPDLGTLAAQFGPVLLLIGLAPVAGILIRRLMAVRRTREGVPTS